MGERIKDEESSHVSPDKKGMDLCARLKEEIVRCRAEYELKKSDSFEGTVLYMQGWKCSRPSMTVWKKEKSQRHCPTSCRKCRES